MRLTKYSHACVRIERDGAVLVVDPGVFSEPEALDGADAVLVTHEHTDHLDVGRLAAAVRARPEITVHLHQSVAEQLTGLDARVSTVEPGDEFSAAGFRVRAYGGTHALIHPDVPRIANLAFLVEDTVYHPGDSFTVPDGVAVDTLFVPVSAPWLKIAESIDFVRAVAPRQAYALHDAILSDAGGSIVDGVLGRLGGHPYERLTPGSTVDL